MFTPKKKLPFFTLIAVILVVAGSVPVMTAAQEDTLTVLCSPHDDWCKAMAEAFEAETGIETTYVRMSSGDALNHVRETKDDPDFSVWWGGPVDGFIAATEEGLLEAYAPPNASLVAVNVIDPDHHWHGVYIGVLGFCSNTALLAEMDLEPPTSWDDLLDPRLEGKVAMAHPKTSGTAFTALWSVVTLKADELEADEPGTGYDEDGVPTGAALDAAFDYFARLNNNILEYTRSGSAPGRLAGEGEIAVAIIFSHDCVKLRIEEFEDVLVPSFAAEGTGYEIGGMGLIKDAPEPEAAKLWIDWALSADGQAIGATVNAFQLATNPATPFNPLSVSWSDVNLLSYNFAAAGLNRTAATARFEAEIAPEPAE